MRLCSIAALVAVRAAALQPVRRLQPLRAAATAEPAPSKPANLRAAASSVAWAASAAWSLGTYKPERIAHNAVGVAQALTHVRDRTLANVRIQHGDALEVLRRVPDGALTMVYLLHPDPWPKNKHAKRRMMNDGPVRMIADKLKPGGEFRFGTDHAVYLRHALMVMRRFTDEFEWVVDGPASWQNRPSGWPETRYEHKARTVYNHEVWYFRFRRR